MANFNDVKVRHKRTGSVITISEKDLYAMHIRANYDLVKEKPKPTKPGPTWKKSEIIKYLEDNNIEFKATEKKSDLLAKI